MARFNIGKAELALYESELKLDTKRTADEFRFTIRIELEDESVCSFAWAALPVKRGRFLVVRTEHCSVHLFYLPNVVAWEARHQVFGGKPVKGWPKGKPLLWRNPAQKDNW